MLKMVLAVCKYTRLRVFCIDKLVTKGQWLKIYPDQSIINSDRPFSLCLSLSNTFISISGRVATSRETTLSPSEYVYKSFSETMKYLWVHL